MKIAVIGSSGPIETKLVKRHREAGHEIIAASPKIGRVNSITGEGLFSRRCFVWPIGADQTSAGFCQEDT